LVYPIVSDNFDERAYEVVKMRFVTVTLSALLLVACGGGSGGGDGGGANIDFPEDTRLIPYFPGDTLSYAYSYERAYYDGSSRIDIDGRLNINVVDSLYTTEKLQYSVQILSSIEDGGTVISSSSEHFAYDEDGSHYRYVLSDGAYSNKEEGEDGVLFLKFNLSVGQSWLSRGDEYIEDDKYNVQKNYAVTSIERVSVPVGSVEAFKIVYSATEIPCGTSFLCPPLEEEADYSGVMWVHPDIGIVKLQEQGEFGYPSTKRSYRMEWSLIEYNIPIDDAEPQPDEE
jgi:hypothetical protein